jgi:hypothetical protein
VNIYLVGLQPLVAPLAKLLPAQKFQNFSKCSKALKINIKIFSLNKSLLGESEQE